MPRWVALSGAVLVGILTAVQARVNGALGAAFGDGLAAAVVSFGSGLAILVVITAGSRRGRATLVRLRTGVADRSIRPAFLLGGLAGALTVATQSLAVATIGVALFTVGVVAGQTVNGIALDRVGFGPAGVVRVTPARAAGGALVIGAVIVTLLGRGSGDAPWWMLVLPVLAGAGIAWQQATNGRLRQHVGSATVATLVNFAGGTLVLSIAFAVTRLVAGAGAGWPAVSPVLYIGGAIGVVYIALSAALVRYLGVLLLGLGSVVGLLAASLVLDAVFAAPAAPPIAVSAVATLVALAGVVVAVAQPRRG